MRQPGQNAAAVITRIGKGGGGHQHGRNQGGHKGGQAVHVDLAFRGGARSCNDLAAVSAPAPKRAVTAKQMLPPGVAGVCASSNACAFSNRC